MIKLVLRMDNETQQFNVSSKMIRLSTQAKRRPESDDRNET